MKKTNKKMTRKFHDIVRSVLRMGKFKPTARILVEIRLKEEIRVSKLQDTFLLNAF
jgi:hypothetical protein